MADIGENIRKFVTRGVEAIGNTASNLANNTKQKINNINLNNQRKELIEELGRKAYECWINGGNLPEELTDEIMQIAEIDQQLDGTRQEQEVSVPESDEMPEIDCSEEKTIETKETSATSAPESITVETPEKDTEVADECVPAEGDADVPDIEVPEKGSSEQNDSPLSSAINALFDDIPQVDKMAEKVNSSLDEMGEQLKKFSTELGKQISDFAEDLLGNNKKE